MKLNLQSGEKEELTRFCRDFARMDGRNSSLQASFLLVALSFSVVLFSLLFWLSHCLSSSILFSLYWSSVFFFVCVCSPFVFFVFVCSEGEGGGAPGDEVGAHALAGQCLSLFSCLPCSSPLFSSFLPASSSMFSFFSLSSLPSVLLLLFLLLVLWFLCLSPAFFSSMVFFVPLSLFSQFFFSFFSLVLWFLFTFQSPRCCPFFLFSRGHLCLAFIKPTAALVVVTAGLLNAL